ncbi:MAG: hypothetical protein AAF726_10315 [Planctomycetota bacterium]
MRDLVVTGIGHVSNVGRTGLSSCAAQRAGIARTAPLDGFFTYDSEELEAPVTGAPVAGITDGFFQTSRWLTLGSYALNDLVTTSWPTSASELWKRTELIWTLPRIAFERFQVPEERTDEFLDIACRRSLIELNELELEPDALDFLADGPCCLAEACRSADASIADRRIDRVVVLATDSWLDPLSVLMLVDEGRVKGPENPTGLCPGEAGVALLLESEAAANARGATVHARILGAATASIDPPDESVDELSDWRAESTVEMGRVLAEAIGAAVVDADLELPFRGDVVIDLNGETWKSMAWGHALTQLHGVLDHDRAPAIVPAASFGDVGSTSAAVGVSVAAHAFGRGSSSSGQSLVVTLSDMGEAAVLLLGAP